MSIQLLNVAKKFCDSKISANEFVDLYIRTWKIERDSKKLLQDEPSLSEMLSSIFCLADMYNADDDRAEYEFNEVELRERIVLLMND